MANVLLSLGLLVSETNIQDSTRMTRTMMAGTFILIHQPLWDLHVFEELAIRSTWYFFSSVFTDHQDVEHINPSSRPCRAKTLRPYNTHPQLGRREQVSEYDENHFCILVANHVSWMEESFDADQSR